MKQYLWDGDPTAEPDEDADEIALEAETMAEMRNDDRRADAVESSN